MSDRTTVAPAALETATTTTMQIATSTASATSSAVSNKSITIQSSAKVAESTTIHFEVVTTPAAQEQGLGGRAVIPDNYAMLFVFPTDGSYGFWMKDMLSSIDMIWVTDNGTIAGIQEDATAASYPGVFYPPYPIRYVLETKVGLAKEKGWTVGTKIQLPLPYGE
jgi:uncharacterized membrane protein (UPF0127 family)